MGRSCGRPLSATAKVRWCLHSINCSLLENSFSLFSWRSKVREVLPGWQEVYISSSGVEQLLAFSLNPYKCRTLRRRVYGILFNEHHRVFTQVFIKAWYTHLLYLYIFSPSRAGRRKSW